MAINFPNSPANNEIYYDSTSGNRYIYNGTEGVWKFYANTVGVSVSSTPPSNVGEGSMWWNRDTGRMFVYYNDGSSLQWVETTPAPGSIDSGLVASYANAAASAVYAVANAGFTVANSGYGVANTALQNTSGTFAGNLTTTGNLVSARVGAGFTPTSGRYFVAGADMARGISVANDRTTHLRFDNNGLNYIFVENFGITGAGHGTGFQFYANSVSSSDTGWTAGSIYAVANGGYTSAATANSHLTFGTVLQNNLNERMRITDTGYVGIGTTNPSYLLHVANGNISVTSSTGAGQISITDDSDSGRGLLLKSNHVNSSNTYVGTNSAIKNLIFGIDQVEKMRLNTSGYLTIPSQPRFLISGSTGMTATTTAAKMNFTGTNYDNAGGWSDANDRYTAPVAGYWVFYSKVNVPTQSNYFYLTLRKNGSDASSTYFSNNQRADLWVWGVVNMALNDYIEVFTQTNTGTASVDNAGYFGGYFLG